MMEGSAYQHLQGLYIMSVTDKTKKIEKPAAALVKPLDVIKDIGLAHQQKTKVLDTWEQDARQLLTASSEGIRASA